MSRSLMMRCGFMLMIWAVCGVSHAQDCVDYVHPKGVVKYTVHKPKGKVIGYETITRIGEGDQIQLNRSHQDKKQAPLFTCDYTAFCTFTGFNVSVLGLFHDPNLHKFYKYPKRWNEGHFKLTQAVDSGEVVESAEMLMTLTAENGFPLANITIAFESIVCEGEQQLSIEGKTYTCKRFKIWQHTKSGDPKRPLVNRRKVLLWLAPDVGMVRREVYDKKGKMLVYTEIN